MCIIGKEEKLARFCGKMLNNYFLYFQPANIAQELSDLVIYCQPMGVKSFEMARQTGMSVTGTSITGTLVTGRSVKGTSIYTSRIFITPVSSYGVQFSVDLPTVSELVGQRKIGFC